MRITKIVACAVIAAATIATASTMSGPAMAAGDEAVIEQRVKFMRADILKPFKAIKKFVKSGEGSAADVAANARKISAAASRIPALFPKGTHRGAYDEKLTRALPKIWEDWNGFKAATDVLVAESAKLATVAATGDAKAIAAQFGATGKKGCGGCHKPFRGAKVK